MALHPEKQQDAETAIEFVKISEAFDILVHRKTKSLSNLGIYA